MQGSMFGIVVMLLMIAGIACDLYANAITAKVKKNKRKDMSNFKI